MDASHNTFRASDDGAESRQRIERTLIMSSASHFASGSADVQSARALVSFVAVALVDRPEAVSVTTLSDGDGVILQLKVASEDLGKVIGKQGRTARAIRTILAASSMKSGKRYSLDIQVG